MALRKDLLAEHGKFQMALPASEKEGSRVTKEPVMERCHLLGTSQLGAPERTWEKAFQKQTCLSCL